MLDASHASARARGCHAAAEYRIRPVSASCRATRGPVVPACASPPTSTPCRLLGIEGIDVTDDGVEREGVKTFGALGVGGLKMKIHKACIARLFERNDLVLDAETIVDLARELAAPRS